MLSSASRKTVSEPGYTWFLGSVTKIYFVTLISSYFLVKHSDVPSFGYSGLFTAMEQPSFPNALSSTTQSPPLPTQPSDQTQMGKGSTTTTTTGSKENGVGTIPRKKPPTPEDLIAHYEAQGLDNKEASMRVIKELRALLYQTAVAGTKKKDKFMTDTVRKLDNVNTRLAVVETKLDTKPGFPEAMAIGVAIGTSTTAVLGGLGGIWGAVKNATSSNNPNHPSSSSS